MNQLEYYSFMGYPAGVLKERYAPYADRFTAGSRVVDVGCGRGEFLELLAERGVAGIGVDADPDMVATVTGKGLEAVRASAADFLAEHPGEFDGIFTAHVAEHMPPEPLVELLRAAGGALREGGRLIVVTPNPRNLLMQLNDFWIDLQHVRYYSPDIMRWLLHLAGLKDVEIGVNPLYELGPAGLDIRHMPRLPTLTETPSPTPGERLKNAVVSSDLRTRIADLEERVNQLTTWLTSLYPPGEYYGTGVK